MGLCLSEEPKENIMCPICLEKINNDYVKLSCGHEFHMACVSRWLGRENTCPLCRKIAIIQYTICIILREKQRQLCYA